MQYALDHFYNPFFSISYTYLLVLSLLQILHIYRHQLLAKIFLKLDEETKVRYKNLNEFMMA